MSLKNFPSGVFVAPIVLPISDARDTIISLPYGKVQAIEFCSTAATGSPTKVTVTITDAQDTPLSIATDVTATAGAVTSVALPAAGMTINSDKTRVVKLAVTFTGGSTPHWNGAVTIQLSPGIA